MVVAFLSFFLTLNFPYCTFPFLSFPLSQLCSTCLWQSELVDCDCIHDVVKCEKISEVTLGTPDVKSGPTRCQKELEDQREGQSCSQSRA